MRYLGGGIGHKELRGIVKIMDAVRAILRDYRDTQDQDVLDAIADTLGAEEQEVDERPAQSRSAECTPLERAFQAHQMRNAHGAGVM